MKHFTDWIIYGLFHRPLHFIFIAMCFSNISYFHLRTSHDHHNWRDNFCKRSYRSKWHTKAQVLRRNSGSVVNSCSVVNSGSLDTRGDRMPVVDISNPNVQIQPEMKSSGQMAGSKVVFNFGCGEHHLTAEATPDFYIRKQSSIVHLTIGEV